jgi:hypothetical protein
MAGFRVRDKRPLFARCLCTENGLNQTDGEGQWSRKKTSKTKRTDRDMGNNGRQGMKGANRKRARKKERRRKRERGRIDAAEGT